MKIQSLAFSHCLFLKCWYFRWPSSQSCWPHTVFVGHLSNSWALSQTSFSSPDSLCKTKLCFQLSTGILSWRILKDLRFLVTKIEVGYCGTTSVLCPVLFGLRKSLSLHFDPSSLTCHIKRTRGTIIAVSQKCSLNQISPPCLHTPAALIQVTSSLILMAATAFLSCPVNFLSDHQNVLFLLKNEVGKVTEKHVH